MAIPSWLSLSSTGGSGDARITLSATTNSSLYARTCQLLASATSYAGISASVNIYQFAPSVTSITLTATWATDVPASGGTATSANCNCTVYAHWDNGQHTDVTSDSVISGSQTVSATTASTRHSAGTLTLTANYLNKTSSASTTIYQAAIGTIKILVSSSATEGFTERTTWTMAGTYIPAFVKIENFYGTPTLDGTGGWVLQGSSSLWTIIYNSGGASSKATLTAGNKTCVFYKA